MEISQLKLRDQSGLCPQVAKLISRPDDFASQNQNPETKVSGSDDFVAEQQNQNLETKPSQVLQTVYPNAHR